MASGSDQNNELSALDNDDGNISQTFGRIGCIIRVFWSFGAWIKTQSQTSKV